MRLNPGKSRIGIGPVHGGHLFCLPLPSRPPGSGMYKQFVNMQKFWYGKEIMCKKDRAWNHMHSIVTAFVCCNNSIKQQGVTKAIQNTTQKDIQRLWDTRSKNSVRKSDYRRCCLDFRGSIIERLRARVSSHFFKRRIS